MSVLVSADELADLLARDAVTLLDARITRDAGGYGNGRAAFEQGHIPGALFADLFTAFSDPDGRFAFARPTLAQMRRTAEALGLRADRRIVVTDALNGAWAARVWWVLRSVAHPDVAVLEGGIAAWTGSGRALVSGAAVAPGGGTFEPVADQAGKLVDADAVLDVLAGRRGDVLLSAVQRAEFDGGVAETRRGHIPGSRSLPYREIVDAAGRIDRAALASHAAALGVTREQPLMLFCGGGVNAAGLALAFLDAGHAGPISVYDGSMNEWRADPSLPLERG